MESNKLPEQNHNSNEQDSDFITERIKQRPINKKKLLRRTIITAAMAVIFALVACLTFLILEPVISNWLYPEEEPAPIELPEETEEMLPEDMIVDDSEMVQPEPPTEIKLEDDQIDRIISNIKLGTGEYATMYSSMAEVAKTAEKSVVTVTASVSNVDWFNDPYESKDQTSGVIAVKTEKEIFILVHFTYLEDADSIMVTFHGGEQVQAQVKKKDVNTNYAVLSVAESDVSPETMEAITVADLTASSSNHGIVGSPVIAIGSPLGTSGSICYGVVTSNSMTLNMIDSYYKLLTTDMYGSANASGVLINLKGQVLGILDNTYNSEDMKNLVSAIGITEFRKVIQRMSNEEDQPYLGTYGTDVTIEANEKLEVPFGAYITEIEIDSPAMNAGIQSGDIIIAFDEKEISIYNDLINAVMEAQTDQTVTLTIMRQGPEEYVQMEIDVTLGNLE